MYIGNRKVIDNELCGTLQTGEDLFMLRYDDGNKEVLTRRMFEQTLRDSPIDLTTLRDNRIFPVASKILELLLNWGVKVDEVDFLMTVLTRSINDNLRQADDTLWGKSRNELTLIDIDDKLRVKKTLMDILNQDQGINPEVPSEAPETPETTPETPASEEPKVEE